MIAEGQNVKAVHDIEGEFVSAGSTGTVTGVVDASKYGMGTLYSVLFLKMVKIVNHLYKEKR